MEGKQLFLARSESSDYDMAPLSIFSRGDSLLEMVLVNSDYLRDNLSDSRQFLFFTPFDKL